MMKKIILSATIIFASYLLLREMIVLVPQFGVWRFSFYYASLPRVLGVLNPYIIVYPMYLLGSLCFWGKKEHRILKILNIALYCMWIVINTIVFGISV